VGSGFDPLAPHATLVAAWCDDGCVTDTPQIIDNPAKSRFELIAEGQLAELVYHQRGDRFVVIHTEVPSEFGGRGLGGVLMMAALERAERENLTVVPLCPFARAWLEHHPDAAAKVTIDWGRQIAGRKPLPPPPHQREPANYRLSPTPAPRAGNAL
jgi:predicted GNAT family acetyltransferase